VKESAIQNATWRTSSYSGGAGECVEVAHCPAGHVAVRDSKDTAGGKLLFTSSGWQDFVGRVKSV
jgi:hypothetical protein